VRQYGLLFDSGCTSLLTNSTDGLLSPLTDSNKTHLTAMGKMTTKQTGIFNRTVYGQNGNSVTFTASWTYDPNLPFDIGGKAALKTIVGSLYVDSPGGSTPSRLQCRSHGDVELTLARSPNGLEWLGYLCPAQARTSSPNAYKLKLTDPKGKTHTINKDAASDMLTMIGYDVFGKDAAAARARKHGREYTSDEDGDGPSPLHISFAREEIQANVAAGFGWPDAEAHADMGQEHAPRRAGSTTPSSTGTASVATCADSRRGPQRSRRQLFEPWLPRRSTPRRGTTSFRRRSPTAAARSSTSTTSGSKAAMPDAKRRPTASRSVAIPICVACLRTWWPTGSTRTSPRRR
jgi:hypothetical protein